MIRRSRYGAAAFVVSLLAAACGAGTGDGASQTTAQRAEPPEPARPGGAVDLLTLAPANANVVLHANLEAVRQDPARYERIASELVTELGLAADRETLRALLDRTDRALGVFVPGDGGRQQGMLVFSGRFADGDFERALAVAAARHGGAVDVQAGAGGAELHVLGDATMAKLDPWTWAVAVGADMRAHLAQLSLSGGARFAHPLLEFGPRIGLPSGSAQAWANQNEQVGIDMVGLVFQGENPQMVRNFVETTRRHLGL